MASPTEPGPVGPPRAARPAALGALRRVALRRGIGQRSTIKPKLKAPKHITIPKFAPPPGTHPTVGTPPAGSNPSGDITRVKSYSDLTAQATGDVNTELQGELAPLQSGLTGLDTREARDRASIEGLFGELQPYAQESANRMRNLNDQTANQEKSIMAATSTRLNALRQSQAQEAQDLAQKMGGPVAMDNFTGGVDPEIQQQTGLGATGLLYSADVGQGEVATASDFAGRVLPAVQREDIVRSHNTFEDQRKSIQDQINTLQQSKSSKVNTRLNDLMTQERSYALQKNQSKLDQIKANRDWRATQRTLKNDDARLALARGQFGLSAAGVTGRYKGKPTQQAVEAGQRVALEQIRLTAQQKNQAAQLGISNARMKETIRSHMESEQIATHRLAIQQQKNAMQLVDSIGNPTSAKPVTVTKKRYIPNDSPEALNALRGKGQYYYDTKRKMYYHYDKVSMTQSEYAKQAGVTTPVTDPSELYGYLTRNGVPPKLALGVVRTKTGRPKWKP